MVEFGLGGVFAVDVDERATGTTGAARTLRLFPELRPTCLGLLKKGLHICFLPARHTAQPHWTWEVIFFDPSIDCRGCTIETLPDVLDGQKFFP